MVTRPANGRSRPEARSRKHDKKYPETERGMSPGGRWLVCCSTALLPVSLMALHLLLAWLRLGGFSRIHSSTGAWLLALVRRVLLGGDYQAAAYAGFTPSTHCNTLFPWLVARLMSLWPGHEVEVGHMLSALSAGLVAWALFLLWHRVGGWIVGIAAAAATLWPAFLATAALIRYDTLAMALALLAVVSAIKLVGKGSWPAWGLPGLLVGLSYSAREYMVLPALAATLTALAIHTRTNGNRNLPSILAFGLGLTLGVMLFSWPLGQSPMEGLRAIHSYGFASGFQGQARSALEASRLGSMWPVFLPAMIGLVLALLVLRGRSRLPLLIMATAVLSFLPFGLSRTQSPQYYLMAHLLLVSCYAAYVAVIPWLWPRVALAALFLGSMAAWALHQESSPRQRGEGMTFHSEAWPVPAEDLELLLESVQQWAGSRPLLLVSDRVENLDGLFFVRTGRPPAFLWTNWMDHLDMLRAIYTGRQLCVLLIQGDPLPQQLSAWQPVGTTRAGAVTGIRYLLPAVEAPQAPGGCWRQEAGRIRGVCLQLAWLLGGQVGVGEALAGLDVP